MADQVKPPELTIIQRAALERLTALGLPAGGRILDAPCGSGALAAELVERGFTATGADVNAEAAQILGPAFALVNLNEPLPWGENSFDAVVSTEGIEHLENHFSFLRETCRILKQGGILLLTTPNITALRSRVRFFGSGFFGRDSRPMNESARNPFHHIGLATLPELRYELHVSGFRLVEVRHTHIKPISYAYAIYAPWMWLYTRIAFRKEKDAPQGKRNKEILSSLFSSSALFGECLLLVARKV